MAAFETRAMVGRREGKGFEAILKRTGMPRVTVSDSP